MNTPEPGKTYPDPGDLFISDLDPIPNAAAQVNPSVPGSPGGLIESVKRAVVTAMREALNGTSITDAGSIYVDIEYPTKEEQYPGIWVNFSITSLVPAGLGQEEWIKNSDDNWVAIRQWTFNGRISLDIAAITSRDRDRLSDKIITTIAFSRLPDKGVIYDQTQDTHENKALISAINDNPYVSMTMSNGAIIPGGQQAQEGGLPWQQDIMVYEDAYSFDVIGQFATTFAHDGTFTLSAVQQTPTIQEQGQIYRDDAAYGNPNLGFGGDPGRGYQPLSPYNYQ